MRCICVCAREVFLHVHESRVHAHRRIGFRTFVYASRIHSCCECTSLMSMRTGVYTAVLPHTRIAADRKSVV